MTHVTGFKDDFCDSRASCGTRARHRTRVHYSHAAHLLDGRHVRVSADRKAGRAREQARWNMRHGDRHATDIKIGAFADARAILARPIVVTQDRHHRRKHLKTRKDVVAADIACMQNDLRVKVGKRPEGLGTQSAMRIRQNAQNHLALGVWIDIYSQVHRRGLP